jgi:hypothetical protein
MATLVVSWATVADAKGPTPVIGEPQNGMTVGEPTVLPISMEWPEEMGVTGQASDIWGESLPWTLVAVPVGALVSTGQSIPVDHVGPDSYVAEFTPPSEGDWRLVFATAGATGALEAVHDLERTFVVEPPTSPGIARWPFAVGAAILAVVIAAFVLRGTTGRRSEPLAVTTAV